MVVALTSAEHKTFKYRRDLNKEYIVSELLFVRYSDVQYSNGN